MKKIDKFIGEYEMFSNFYPCSITIDFTVYPSVEHAYQAMKSLDEEVRFMISNIDSPGRAKKEGRRIKIRSDWEEVKINEMMKILKKKFFKEPFKSKLMNTKDAELIEGNNWHDNFWGSCTCERCGNKGKNTLGIMLTVIRENLIEMHIKIKSYNKFSLKYISFK